VYVVCYLQFETIFSQKPSLYNKFWATHHTPEAAASVSFVTVPCSSFHNFGTAAKQVAMVWACAAKRRQWLGEKMYGVWRRGCQSKR